MSSNYVLLPNDAEVIRSRVDAGITVYVDSTAYVVVKDGIGQYLIHCAAANHYIGLTWRDGRTLNGGCFFMEEQ